MSLWPSIRAWAGLIPETHPLFQRTVLPLLCCVVKCSHIAAQAAPRTGRELAQCGFEGKSSWHFCICCFLKPKPLALVVSQWEQLVVSFFAVLQGNVLQVCTSNLAEKVSTHTCLAEDSALSFGWEDKNGGRGQSVSAGRVIHCLGLQ